MQRGTLHRGAALLVAILLGLVVAACERDAPPQEPGTDDEIEARDLTKMTDGDILDLLAIEEEDMIDVQVGRSTLFEACHEIFEDHGQPRDWPDHELPPRTVAYGCNAVGFVEREEGRLAIAYDVPIEEDGKAKNLRFSLFDESGQLLWTRLMDRSREAEHFLANHRSSFLTDVDDRLLCAGTRWMSSTQLKCARLDSGQVVFDGRLDFVAGLDLFSFDGSLFSADATGITRRYPFTGAEMRHREFGARGGLAGFYATDESRIFFVPSDSEPLLSAWDLKTLEPIWHAHLPNKPETGYFHASADLKLLIFLVDEYLVGVDTETGELRMIFAVGESRPQVASSQDQLYLMIRHRDSPAGLHAISPDGRLIWSARPPSGTLTIDFTDEQLRARSVRTLRSVEPAGGDGDD